MKLQTHLKKMISSMLCLFITMGAVLAQASSESIYSDQAFDPINEKTWYQDPFIWGGFILVAGIVILWLKRRK